MRARLLKGLVGVLLVGALALAWASVDRCGDWPSTPPQLMGLGRANGPLKVGAANVGLALDFPATVAGYPPLRSTVEGAATPLEARATVLDVEGQRLALVQLDVLLVTARMQLAVAQGFPGRVWLNASHTHSSVGGYDARLAAELAALGAYSPRDEERLVTAARTALERATAALTPASLALAEASTGDLAVPRSGAAVDSRLTIVRFSDAAKPIAQWLILSAHPTMVGRREGLDCDWPGRLAAKWPVTLVLQGAGGNASVNRDRAATPAAFADAIAALANRAEPTPIDGPVPLAWAEVAFGLPRPDASPLTPVFRTAVEGVLCEDSEHDAMLTALRLGPLRLLFVTLEPSARAGALLEEQGRANRVVSLTNGYHGYLEPAEVMLAGTGESSRQYFGPNLARQVSDAARLASDALK